MSPRGGRTAAGRPGDALRHWEKAQRFLAAARHDRDGEHWEAAVSSAILAGIHLVDAILLHYTGRRGASGRHEDAVDRIESLSELDVELRRRLAAHLRSLLEVKNLVQYSGDASRASDAEEALQQAARAFEAARAVARAAGSAAGA